MNNNSDNLYSKDPAELNIPILENLELIIIYTPFLLIALGVTGNSAVLFFITKSKSLRKMSSMIILIFVSIVDTLSLFVWNLDHYYLYYNGKNYEELNIYLCRIMNFIQYFSLQSSGFLLSLLSIDRFITIASTPGSFVSKLPFRTPKSVTIWSACTIMFMFILNSHILFLNGYQDSPSLSNKTMDEMTNSSLYSNEKLLIKSNEINCGKYKTGFDLYKEWNILNIYVYSFIPTGSMLLFNSLLIYKTYGIKNNKTDTNSNRIQNKKRKMTISLLMISLSFLFLTLPGSIFYGYLIRNYKAKLTNLIGSCLNFLTFFNHSSLLLNLLIFNYKFRGVFLSKFNRKRNATSLKYTSRINHSNIIKTE